MTGERPAGGAGLLRIFAALSLAAVALGCVAAAAHGAPVGVWGRNLAAWGLGALIAAGLGRWAGRAVLSGFLLAAPVGLAVSLVSAGQLGVHRWIDLGPLHMNAAEVLAPSAVVACAVLARGRGWPWIFAAAALALLAAQPDASQATAFGAALLAILVFGPGRGAVRGGAAILATAAMAGSWFRPDPLAPVLEVEGIMGLAWGLAPLAGVAAWLALAGAALTPLTASRRESGAPRAAGVALALYALVSVLTTLVGAFPVPLVGMGMSPILGLWLGVGLLAAVSRRVARPALP